MDPIDEALTEAWARVAPRVRADRLEALRRSFRRTRPLLSRPIRPWCLCLRAGDRRLNVHAWVPKYLHEQHEPHEITIFSDTIRRLCKPVTIPWPGMDWTRAAARLGRHPQVIRRWIAHGVLQCRLRNARSLGKRGKPVPEVWSSTPLDPNADVGRAPDPVWGSMWQHLWERVPDDLEFTVERVPVCARRTGETLPRHGGWKFLCPGIGGESCGRRVTRLFIPLRPWTMLYALGLDDPLAVTLPFGGRLRSATHSRPVSPSRPGGPLDGGFPFLPACERCHRVRGISLVNRKGWNEFVAHISAGVLQGHEVVPPRGLIGRRRRAYRSQRRRAAPRRDRVLHLVSLGLTNREIAVRMGIGLSVAKKHVAALLRRHGACSRAGLCAALGLPHVRPIAARRALVLSELWRGLSARQIGARLGIGLETVYHDCKRLYREHGVYSREQLLARLRGEALRGGGRASAGRAAEERAGAV